MAFKDGIPWCQCRITLMLRVWAAPSLGFIMEASLCSLVSVLIIKKNFSMGEH